MARHTINLDDAIFPHTVEHMFAASSGPRSNKKLLIRTTFGKVDSVTTMFVVVENGQAVGDYVNFADAVADYNKRP